jgi:hypothetical protein
MTAPCRTDRTRPGNWFRALIGIDDFLTLASDIGSTPPPHRADEMIRNRDFSLVARRHRRLDLFSGGGFVDRSWKKQLVFASFLRPQPSRIGWCVNLFRSGPERTI